MDRRRHRFLSLLVAATLALGLAASALAADLPATGQTTVYTANKNDNIPAAVAVPDDGTLQAGASLSYTDNGDGTITDHNTGLMWEKKGDSGGLHDKDNYYAWSGTGSQETIWDWLDDVNASFLTDLGLDAGDRTPAVADGYFLYLKPLAGGLAGRGDAGSQSLVVITSVADG